MDKVKHITNKNVENVLNGLQTNTDHHLELYKEFEARYIAEGHDPYRTYIFWVGYNNGLRNARNDLKDYYE